MLDIEEAKGVILKMKILTVEGLYKTYPSNTKEDISVLKNISFSIDEGKVLGIVGESGSGKTTLAKCLLGIENYQNGDIFFKGNKLNLQRTLDLRRKIQFIFQDPYASLNPRLTIESIVGEGLRIHNLVKKKHIKKRVIELLEDVGLDETAIERYPHEFSGGQRQRIGIARSLAVNPELLICDEPIASLDISIQSQIINLLLDLQKKQKLTMIFIAHDLAMVRYVSDTIAVMNKGEIIEKSTTEELYTRPKESYTKKLIEAMPTTLLF